MADSKVELVLGVDGQLGSAIRASLTKSGRKVIGTSRRPEAETNFDLKYPADFLIPANVTVAYLCAGVTSIALCRQSPKETHELNVTNTMQIIRRLCEQGIFVVVFSTNLVFDGNSPQISSDSSFNPMTEYGRQKADLERALADFSNVAILRLTKVLSPESPLIRTWREAWDRGVAVKAFHDAPLAPLALDYLLGGLELIVSRRLSGVFQFSSVDDIKYCDLAVYLSELWQLPKDAIKDISLAEVRPPVEHLPQYSSLDPSRILNELGLPSCTAEEMLKRVFVP